MGSYYALKKDDKYVIVYVDEGKLRYLDKYSFDNYDLAAEFIGKNKEELNSHVEVLKLNEQQAQEAEEEQARKDQEEKEAAEKLEADKKAREKSQKFKAWLSGFLAAVITLVGGHFVGVGVKSVVDNTPSSSTHGSVDPTETTGSTTPEETEPTLDVEGVQNAIEGIKTEDDTYSTENMELLIAEFVKIYADSKLELSTEDLTKFVAIANIDKLVEENREFAQELFGVQTAEEFLNDAAKTIGVTYMYNHTMWEADKNTENFIWVSEALADNDPQKAKLQLMEEYVKKIAEAAALEDADEVNRLATELVGQLTLVDGELNALDDGVEFIAQVYFALINNSIGRNYLTQELRDYFNTRASAEQNVSNIFTVYEKCTSDSKTKTLN